MKHIGLLMIREENDILERTLFYNARKVDRFYVLDGTVPNEESRAICEAHPNCDGYWTDADLPDGYPEKPCDGWRQFLLEHAYADHGYDNWFLLLHGDEVWTHDVRAFTRRMGFAATAFIYQLPFFFPRAGEGWDDDVHPLEQLHWYLGPGWPEVRLFRGGENVRYDVAQHFNVVPSGVKAVASASAPILHYPYRSPSVQRERAAMHESTGFDPDNYRHILNGGAVYWTDEMIADRMCSPRFSRLGSHIMDAVAV